MSQPNRCSYNNCLTVTADVKNITAVLGYVEEDLAQKNVAPKIWPRLITITEEVFSNIAQYAYSGSGPVNIETSLNADSYTIRFRDSGVPYDPLQKTDPNMTLPAEERDIGGLGIFIVKKMADSVTYAYQDGQNILTVSVKI